MSIYIYPSSGGNPALKGRVFQKRHLGGVRSPSQIAIIIPGLKAWVHPNPNFRRTATAADER